MAITELGKYIDQIGTTENTTKKPRTKLGEYIDSIQPKPKTHDQSYLGALGSAAMQGAGGLAADVYIGASDIAANIHNLFTDDENDWRPQDMRIASGARHFKKQLEEDYFPVKPEHEGIGTDIARGLGQFAPQVLAGGAGLAAGAGRVGAALIGSSLGSTQRISQIGEEYDRSVAEGKTTYDPVDRFSAQLMGAGTTLATETPVVIGALKRLNSSTGGLISDTLKGFAGEGLQEMVEKVSDDLVAKQIIKYDPDRQQFFDTPEAAKELGYEGLVGGSVGGIVNFMTSALGIKHRGRIEKRVKEVEETIKQAQLEQARDIDNKDRNINPITQKEFTNPELQKAWRTLSPRIDNVNNMRLNDAAVLEPNKLKAAEDRIVNELNSIVSKHYLGDKATPESRSEVEGFLYEALGEKGVLEARELRAKEIKAEEDAINAKRTTAKQKAAERKKAKEEKAKAEAEKAKETPKKEGEAKTAAEKPTTAPEKPVEATEEKKDTEVAPVKVVTPEGLTEVEKDEEGTVVSPFTATHEASDGELLQATEEKDTYLNADGDTVIDPAAEPIATEVTQKEPEPIVTPEPEIVDQPVEEPTTNINDAELQDKIRTLKTVEEADKLASDLYGTEENSEGNLREQYIAAWVNAKDMVEEGTLKPEEIVDVIRNSIDISKEEQVKIDRLAAIRAATQKVQETPVQTATTKEITEEQNAALDAEEDNKKAGIIVAKNNIPFKTRQAALGARTRQKFKESHEVIPYENGFALRKLPETIEPVPITEEVNKAATPLKSKKKPVKPTIEEEVHPLFVGDGGISPANIDQLENRWVRMLESGGNPSPKVIALTRKLDGFVKSGKEWNSEEGRDLYKQLVHNLTGGTVDPYKVKQPTVVEETPIEETTSAPKAINQAGDEITVEELPPATDDTFRRQAGDVGLTEEETKDQEERVAFIKQEVPLSQKTEVVPAEEVEVEVAKENTKDDLANIEERIENQKLVVEDLKADSFADEEELAEAKRYLLSLQKERRAIVGKAPPLKAKSAYSDAEIEAEINEAKKFDSTLDEDAEDFQEMTVKEGFTGLYWSPNKFKTPEHIQRSVFNKFIASLDPSILDDIDILFVRDPSEIPDITARKRYQDKLSAGEELPLGFHQPRTESGKKLAVIFANPKLSAADIEFVIFHEVVGHYGFRKLFGSQLKQFLSQMMDNKAYRQLAYNFRTRWSAIGDKLSKQDGNMMEVVDDDGEIIRVNRDAMLELAEELLSEYAGSWSNPDFRKANKQYAGFLNRFITWIKHFLRKHGFGRIVGEMTNDELYGMISDSYLTLTKPKDAISTKEKNAIAAAVNRVKKDHTKFFFIKDNTVTERQLIDEANKKAQEFLTSSNIPGSIKLAENLKDPVKFADDFREAAALTGESETYIQKVSRLHQSDIGKVNYNWWQKLVTQLEDKIRRSNHFSAFRTLGNMSMPKVYEKLEGDLKGSVGNAQRKGRVYAHLLKKEKVNDEQHAALFEFFTTKNADHTKLPVSEKLQNLAKELKTEISDMGQMLVKMGRLPKEIEEANRDQYLPTRYWKYLSQYLGSGKKLSFQNYLKEKDPDMTMEDKAYLGQIRDTSILVPETVAVLARDIALHNFFETAIEFDKQNGYGWFLGKNAYVTVDGRRMNSEGLSVAIQHLHDVIALGQKNPLYATEEEVESNRQKLARYELAQKDLKDQVRTELTNLLESRGDEATPNKVQQALTAEYKFITEPSFGALQYKWVHKGIYDDLVESFDEFSTERNDIMSRTFATGGTVEKLHQMWKANKVILNPPSWIRNAVGNFVLLDIGTKTNMASLSKMLFEEMKWHLIDGKPSDMMLLARDKGLFDNTYSMTELYLLQQSTVDRLKRHMRTAEADGFTKTSIWRMWYSGLGTFHDALEYANNVYGGLEGLFKTVAMRDHIQKWLKDNGYRSLDAITDPAIRETVIDEAVSQANKIIFDYSKVPAWLRTTRKTPFVGAPFLTFTYKSIPATIDAMARRPHKVLKYMLLPYLLNQIAMSAFDWDDEDLAEVQRKMPMWMQEQSSVFIMPWKDANGKVQGVPFGYYIPWSPAVDWGLMAHRQYDSTDKILSTMGTAKDILFDMGFLGGPAPTVMTALLSNKDPFTKQDIYQPGATSYENQANLSRFMYTMWMPTFLTSYGVLGRLIDQTGIEIPPFSTGDRINRYGTDKETLAQSLARGVGVNIYGFDPKESNRSNLKYFESERRKIITARSISMKDRNLSVEQKASRMREYTEKIKRLNEKQRRFLNGE